MRVAAEYVLGALICVIINILLTAEGVLGPCIYRFFVFKFANEKRITNSFFVFRFQICDRKKNSFFVFKSEVRKTNSFFVFKSEVRKTKNEFVFRFCI